MEFAPATAQKNINLEILTQVSFPSRRSDQYGRTVAVCSISGEDVAGWPVRNVLGFDWPRYSKGKYAGVQKEAERAGRGVSADALTANGPARDMLVK